LLKVKFVVKTVIRKAFLGRKITTKTKILLTKASFNENRRN